MRAGRRRIRLTISGPIPQGSTRVLNAFAGSQPLPGVSVRLLPKARSSRLPRGSVCGGRGRRQPLSCPGGDVLQHGRAPGHALLDGCRKTRRLRLHRHAPVKVLNAPVRIPNARFQDQQFAIGTHGFDLSEGNGHIQRSGGAFQEHFVPRLQAGARAAEARDGFRQRGGDGRRLAPERRQGAEQQAGESKGHKRPVREVHGGDHRGNRLTPAFGRRAHALLNWNGMIVRFILVWLCCAVAVLPGRAQETAAVAALAPTAPDWKTLYEQADSAARQWEARSRYLEASCQSLRASMDADTAAQTLTESREALPAVPPFQPELSISPAKTKPVGKAVDYMKLFGLADARGKAWRARAQRLETRRDSWTARVQAAADPVAREIAAVVARASLPPSYAPALAPAASVQTPSANADDGRAKTVHVRDYQRQDGTRVQSHERRPPGH